MALGRGHRRSGGPPLSSGSALGSAPQPGTGRPCSSPRVYVRGGLTLKALRDAVGDAKFFTIMTTWAADHRLANATTDDFLQLVDEVGGSDAESLVSAWLCEPEPP
jgi:aminopeptidase N